MDSGVIGIGAKKKRKRILNEDIVTKTSGKIPRNTLESCVMQKKKADEAMEPVDKDLRKTGAGSAKEKESSAEDERLFKALLESEEKYKKLFDNAPVGIGITDFDGRLIDFNDAMLKPGRYRREDVERIGSISELYYAPEERSRILSIARKQGFVDRVEVQFKRKDGTPYDAVISLKPVQMDGKACWQAIVEDVSAQKQAEKAARESQRRWQDIVYSAVVGIYQVTSEGRFILVNPKFAQLFGYDSPEEFLSSVPNIYQLYVNPEDRPPILQEVNKKGFVDGATARFRRKDGQIIWIRISARVIKVESEETAYEGFMTDITERKQYELDLRESERKHRTVLEANPDPVVFYDNEGRVVYFNPAFSKVFGWNLAERVGKKMDLFVPDDTWSETRMMIQKVVAGEGFTGLKHLIPIMNT